MFSRMMLWVLVTLYVQHYLCVGVKSVTKPAKLEGKFEQQIAVGVYRVRHVQIPFYPFAFHFCTSPPLQRIWVLCIVYMQQNNQSDSDIEKVVSTYSVSKIR